MTVPTHGLTHIALAVRDPERSARFYCELFGGREYYRDESQIQILGPGLSDVLAFERDPDGAGQAAGVLHFGFRLRRADDIDAAVLAVQRAGGTIVDRGTFTPAEPYVFFHDPDGYLVELWYEKPVFEDASEGGRDG